MLVSCFISVVRRAAHRVGPGHLSEASTKRRSEAPRRFSHSGTLSREGRSAELQPASGSARGIVSILPMWRPSKHIT
jgi:hypothetical protein